MLPTLHATLPVTYMTIRLPSSTSLCNC